MESTNQPLDMLVEKLGVQKQIREVLFAVFPSNEFVQHLDLFKSGLNNPNSLKPFISELQKQLNLGAFSHTTGVMYCFLAMDDKFEFLTRDYIRRCCDMVEYITKHKVAGRLRLELEVDKQPLGSVINVFRNKYSSRFPDGLLETLARFNLAIYRPAKHDVVNKENERMFSVADAIAVTFIAVRLCQRLDDFQKKYPFG